MKIDFIYEYVYPFSKGGAEKRIFEYANILNKIHEVQVVSMQWWDGNVELKKNGIYYKSIYKNKYLNIENEIKRIFISLYFGLKVFFYTLNTKSDVLDFEVVTYFPIIFARCAVFFKKNKPIIVGYWSEYEGEEYWRKHYKFIWWTGVLLEKVSFLSCEMVVTNSLFTKKRLQQVYGTEKKNITVIPPISLSIDNINKIPTQEKKYDIIYYGRIIKHKHVEYVVNVVKDLVNIGYNAKALIIGMGPDVSSIKKLIGKNNLGKNIIHTDFIEEYNDLIVEIKKSRIMIQPSEREGFGITVVEANACGLPVFIVDFIDNAAKDLIKNGKNGFVCKNYDDLSQKVQDFLQDDGLIEQLENMSQQSIQIAQKYSEKTMQKKVIKYYGEL